MAGLKRIMDQSRFRQQCVKAAEKTGLSLGDSWTVKSEKPRAYEDDGVLHVEKHGLHVWFGFGQDTPGEEANPKIIAALMALGMKRQITKDVLVSETCEDCNGDGYTTCDEDHEHPCGNCEGSGLVEPEYEVAQPKNGRGK